MPKNTFVAYGQNIITEKLDQNEETIIAKVVSTPIKKCAVGSIVLYNDRDYENITVGSKKYHVIWEPKIRAILVNKKQVDNLINELPSMEKEEKWDD